VSDKSEKELAFLKDLFIAPDWGERFAELIDEHVKLPEKGRALYLNCGTGGHALALQERGGHELKWLWVDESNQSLELAQAKAATTKAPAELQLNSLESLSLDEDQFDLALAEGSMIAPDRVPAMLAELVRVARPGATVALSLTTSASFGEFFSIYWEALLNCDLTDQALAVETLITELPIASDIEELARLEGMVDITSWTQIEEFAYDSGEAFISAPLISDFLMPGWLRAVPEEVKERVVQEIAHLIDEERHEAEFSLTVKATLVMGRKAGLPLAG
jgi:ubiquinone/menaquinone biosynthesis C-methylase UbiE